MSERGNDIQTDDMVDELQKMSKRMRERGSEINPDAAPKSWWRRIAG